MRLYMALLTVSLITFSGCSSSAFNFFSKKAPKKVEENATVEANATIESAAASLPSKKEGKYQLKPEPYSLASNESDPELLGPQSTVKTPLSGGDYKPTIKEEKSSNSSAPISSYANMSKQECINMIGADRFNSYVKRFGGEDAAIRRCVILKRTRGA